MDTKQGIEFMEEVERLFNITKSKQVIELLKRGEKDGQIVEEIKNIFKVRKSRNGGEWTGNNLLLNIYDIEQKYFLKEIIEGVVKGIAEQIKEGAEIARKEIDRNEN